MESVEEIWSEYRQALQAFLQKRVSDPDDVEDLLQEVLVRSHEALPKLRERDSLRGWLFRIARNATIDFYRGKGRAQAVHPDDLWYDDPDESVFDELEECVLPFLSKLSPEKSELLTAIEIQGISQKDYAKHLGVSYSTLKSRVQSARTDLRRLFEQCCAFTIDGAGNIAEYRPKSDNCGSC